jgi:uncharacterized protein YeaO (DUF488 family)
MSVKDLHKGIPRATGVQAMKMTGTVRTARVYDTPASGDGIRVLVDRVWPRGLTRESAHVEEWCKQVAPSTELRKWYAHDPVRFAEFARRYRAELQEPERGEAVEHLREVAQAHNLTLVTATKAIEISQAAVLADVIQGA